MKTLIVKYSCDGCGTIDEKVVVPARENPDEDVRDYMTRIMAVVTEKHLLHHLFCEAKNLKDLKIPINKGQESWIGQPIENNEQT